jgi:CRISPR-associated protein Csd2
MDTSIMNRYEFVLLYDVENGNPNGDPDDTNKPRKDNFTGKGLVTDVCIKHKIRNYVELVKSVGCGYDIYITPGKALNDKHADAYIAIGEELVLSKSEKKKKDKKAEKAENDKSDAEKITKARMHMCGSFYDVRAFGAVMSTGVNCGQVRGPVQLCFSTSIDKINPENISITRCAVTTVDDVKAGKVNTIGNKQIVPYGLYRLEGFISAKLAQQTGFDEADLELLFESMINMFEHDHSASRGKMSARKLFVFKHASDLGCCQAHVLFDKIKVKNITDNIYGTSFSDYEISIDTNMPKGVEFIEKL